MDSQIKGQLYDIISKAKSSDTSTLVEVENYKINKEDVEEFQKLKRQLEIITENSRYVKSTDTILGTDILKPRFRKADETEEEYVQFLQEYYAIYFKEAKNKTPKKSNQKTIKSKKEVTTNNSSLTTNQSSRMLDLNEISYIDLAKDNKKTYKTDPSNKMLDLQDLPHIDLTKKKISQNNTLDKILDLKEIPGINLTKEVSEEKLEEENLEETEEEVVSIINIPKIIWERIKQITFIKKSIQFLDKIIKQNKKEEEKVIEKIKETTQELSKEEIIKKDNSDNIKNQLCNRNDVFNISDNIDKIIINGVEPLTGTFNSTSELFSKIDNGTAYDYSELEQDRIANVKSTISPEMDNFYISKIIKKNNDGSIEYTNSVDNSNLDNVIFEVSSRDIPEYVFARYSGKNIKDSYKSQGNIQSKAM